MSATYERGLRVVTLLTTAIATPFLIALTVISVGNAHNCLYRYRNITAFCFAYFPLAITAVASAVSIRHHRKHNRVPGPRLAILDGIASIAYLGILTPIWAVEIEELELPGFGLLAGYCTAPMIVNMLINFYVFAYNARSIWSSYAGSHIHERPNCHSNFTVGIPKIQGTTRSGERYSLLRGEDYLDAYSDAEHYIDTSTRPSKETMRPEVEDMEDGKGKINLEV